MAVHAGKRKQPQGNERQFVSSARQCTRSKIGSKNRAESAGVSWRLSCTCSAAKAHSRARSIVFPTRRNRVSCSSESCPSHTGTDCCHPLESIRDSVVPAPCSARPERLSRGRRCSWHGHAPDHYGCHEPVALHCTPGVFTETDTYRTRARVLQERGERHG